MPIRLRSSSSLSTYFVFASALVALALVSSAQGQNAQGAAKVLYCGALFDSHAKTLRHNVAIEISGEHITRVAEAAQAPAGAIDLSQETCLPGLIDTHTHVLLQGDITAEDYDVQLLKESQAYRAIVATQSAKRALEYGFTTIRDLEVALRGDPLADVTLLQKIDFVMKGGVVYKGVGKQE